MCLLKKQATSQSPEPRENTNMDRHVELKLLFDEMAQLNENYSKRLKFILERIKLICPSNKDVIIYDLDMNRTNTLIPHYEQTTGVNTRKRGQSSPPILNSTKSINKITIIKEV